MIKHPTSLTEVFHSEVAEAFQIFYKKLYDTPEETQNKRKLEGMFKNLNLAKLSASEADVVAPIRESEIQDVIKSLKNNKSPGTDSLPGEFYQAFMEELVPKPIYPVLFALCIEPLAELIRGNDQIEGIVDE